MNKIDTQKIKNKVKSVNQRASKCARKKIVQGTSVAVLLVSILTGLAFSGPSEITADQTTTQINQPPIVMDIGDYANTTVDEDDDEDAACEKKGFARFVQKFKQAVLSLPKAVRILLIVPLWAIGTGIMALFSAFWRLIVATPVGGFLLSTAIGFAILLGLYVLTAKILFPDVPISKILNKQSIIAIAVIAVLLGLADVIVPLFWRKYPLVAWLVKTTIGIIVVSALASRVKHFSIDNILPQSA